MNCSRDVELEVVVLVISVKHAVLFENEIKISSAVNLGTWRSASIKKRCPNDVAIPTDRVHAMLEKTMFYSQELAEQRQRIL